jgi:hypothetical protein
MVFDAGEAGRKIKPAHSWPIAAIVWMARLARSCHQNRSTLKPCLDRLVVSSNLAEIDQTTWVSQLSASTIALISEGLIT